MKVAQLTLPGMEPPAPPAKVQHLWKLYLDAASDYWGPIAERIASERELGPEGITERELADVPEYMDLDDFRAELDARGVPYK